MPKFIEMGAEVKVSATGILGDRGEVDAVKELFGIALEADEEVCEETAHELGCGCPDCVADDTKEV